MSAGRAVILAGGTGGAKLARGMADVLGPERLDMVLLDKLMSTFPAYDFIFVGPCKSEPLARQIRTHSNAHLTNELDYGLLPGVIQSFDVAIVPHLANSLTEGNDLLKIQDYFACGVPVVSTPCSNVQRFGEALAVCSDHELFCAAVASAVDCRSAFRADAGRKIAEASAWNGRIGSLSKWLIGALEGRRCLGPT